MPPEAVLRNHVSADRGSTKIDSAITMSLDDGFDEMDEHDLVEEAESAAPEEQESDVSIHDDGMIDDEGIDRNLLAGGVGVLCLTAHQPGGLAERFLERLTK